MDTMSKSDWRFREIKGLYPENTKRQSERW